VFACLAVAPSAVSAATHPRTVVDSVSLARLRTSRDAAGFAEMTAALRSAMSARASALSPSDFGDPRLLGNAVGGLALAAQILDGDGYRALARAQLVAALGWSDWGFGEGDDLNRAHLLIGATIAWDVLWPDLDDATRIAARTRIASEAQRFAAAMDDGIWWSGDYMQNHSWIDPGALGVAALALQDEDERAQGWLSRVQAHEAKLRAALGAVSDGTWHEGIGYQQYGWSFAMPWWMAAQRAGISAGDYAMARAYGRYRLAVQLPGRAREYVSTHGDWSGWSGPGSGQILRYLASRWRDPHAAEAGRRWAAAGARSTRPEDLYYLALEYVSYDPNVPNAETALLSPDFFGADQQVAVMRSGWAPGAAVLAMKSGVMGGRGTFDRLRAGGFPGGFLNLGHDHVDDLSLWMHADGEWMLPECVGYASWRTSDPEAWRTEFHNSILVDGAGQLGDERDSDSSTRYPWFFRREASARLRASTAHYSVTSADGSRLYPDAAGVASLVRTVAFSRDDGHVVLHDAASLSGSHRVEQVFHFMDSASWSAPWLRGGSKNDRVLGIRVVAPASVSVNTASQTAAKLSKQFEPDGSVSQARVGAPAGSDVVFLEVLWPGRGALWSTRPAVAALDDARPWRGLSLPLGEESERWIFAPAGGTQAGDLSLSAGIGMVRARADGTPVRLLMVGAGALADREGTRRLVQASIDGGIEIEYLSGTAELTGSDPAGLRFHGPGVTRVRFSGVDIPWHREGEDVVLGPATDDDRDEEDEADAGPGDDGGSHSDDAGGADAGTVGPSHGDEDRAIIALATRRPDFRGASFLPSDEDPPGDSAVDPPGSARPGGGCVAPDAPAGVVACLLLLRRRRAGGMHRVHPARDRR